MVRGFLKTFQKNPQDFSDYGSENWVNALMNYLKDSPQYKLELSDVRSWMKTESIFEELNERYEYCPVKECSGTSGYVVDGGNLPVRSDDDNEMIFEVDQEPTEVISNMSADVAAQDVYEEALEPNEDLGYQHVDNADEIHGEIQPHELEDGFFDGIEEIVQYPFIEEIVIDEPALDIPNVSLDQLRSRRCA
ncbi:unnamed protein product [Orchesella dallaii]|uniref:Uncharacterized protein n=1 Tax=Orchesella dallaii TaxID=48710 RepID=A0ABP1REH8_9HEXA